MMNFHFDAPETVRLTKRTKGTNDMNITVKFNDDSEWNWSWWEEPLMKAVFEHAQIEAIEIYAEEVEDYEHMTLFVKEKNPASGKCVKREYALRFFEDCAIENCRMFAYFLWKVRGGNMKLIDQGIYQIRRKDDGTYKCLCIAEET